MPILIWYRTFLKSKEMIMMVMIYEWRGNGWHEETERGFSVLVIQGVLPQTPPLSTPSLRVFSPSLSLDTCSCSSFSQSLWCLASQWALARLPHVPLFISFSLAVPARSPETPSHTTSPISSPHPSKLSDIPVPYLCTSNSSLDFPIKSILQFSEATRRLKELWHECHIE